MTRLTVRLIAALCAAAGGAAAAEPSRPVTRPAVIPIVRPTTATAYRPTTQPTARPSTQPAARLPGQAASRPSSRPSTQPSTRPSTQPAASPPSAVATSRPYEAPAAAAGVVPITALDQLVLARLEKLKIEPAAVCSDAVFVRRAFLDVIGTLPTEQEAREFITSTAAGKRAALIEKLLARDEFATYWALKWGDLLRIKAEFPINLWPNAAQAYHRFVFESIKDNKPYDRFARELLTSSGSNFRKGQVNFYRAVQMREPKSLAQAAALTFMGCRAENWPKDRLAGMSAFFTQVGYKSTAEWKEEIVFWEPNSTAKGLPAPVFPDGTAGKITSDRDPRELFADWLIDAKNPWFTKAIANRAWFWLMGRGIVHEPDDIRPDNPPSNPELLAYLEREMIASKYDMKQLFRLILNSRTYQLASVPRCQRPEAAANFAHYPLRRLEAEVLMDALCQITGTTERYSSPIPEPFTFIPENTRSIALSDGSITSSFLDMFGRSSRDSGLELERNNRVTAAQRLHMLNSSHIQRKIEQGRKLQDLFFSRREPREVATSLYLTILSRFPTDEELRAIKEYIDAGKARGREVLVDVTWALFNGVEFQYRH